MVMILLATMGGLAACGDDSGSDDGGVDATLSDFEIELSASSAPAGEVTFNVQNDGPSTHEFVVFQTDLADDALPTDDNGDVAESDSSRWSTDRGHRGR